MTVRISDADRDEAVEALTQHRVAGRLDEESFMQRVEKALAAQEESQLRTLFADLPAPWPDVAVRSRKIEPPSTHPAVAAFTDLASKAAGKVVEAVESFTGVQMGRKLKYPQVISASNNRIRLSDLAIAAMVDHHGKVDPVFPTPVEAVQKALVNEGLLEEGSITFGSWDDATGEAYRGWRERSGARAGGELATLPDKASLARLGERYGFSVDPARRTQEEAAVRKRLVRAERHTRTAQAGVAWLVTAAIGIVPAAMFVTGTWQLVAIVVLVAVVLGSAAISYGFTRLGQRTWEALANETLPALQPPGNPTPSGNED